MLVPGRNGSEGGYRYGFNGKEKDDEIKGVEGVQYDYGFRIYDARLGKFLSQDPLLKEYPFYSPYQFAGNSPIMAVDLDGLELKISNTDISCEQVNNKKAKLKMTFDSHVHFKVLNTTGVKLEGFEKVQESAEKAISKSFSDRKGNANFLAISDFEGNDMGGNNALYYDIEGQTKKFTSSYQVITSLDQINEDDYVIIITNKPLNTQTETGRVPPAYTYKENQAMIINIDDYGAKKNRMTGNYDFNGGGRVVVNLGNTISHEFGHELGLGDKYEELKDLTTKPLDGYENNRMGNSSASYINKAQSDIVFRFLTFFHNLNELAKRKSNFNLQPNTDAKEDTKKLLDDNNITVN